MFFIGFSLALAAFIVSYILFSPSVSLAKILGAIDIPNERKLHSHPMARLGGLTFFVSFFLSFALLPIDAKFKIAILVSGTSIFLVGLFDDATNISPFTKLLGQALSSILYIFVLLPKPKSISDAFFVLIALGWMIFITNAINLCDGLDALASGITSSQALCISVIALISGHFDVFATSLLLLFSILGFLPRNFPPAKTFMGDCGSLFLGFILSAISIKLIFESTSIIILLSLLMIFRLPSADAIQSFFRRALRSKNPFSADKGHFHHKLLDFGFTKECASLALISLSLLFGLVGVIISVI
jgi:UDP-GlcNAc:undecaprenyl-phosphate GlcNAc-1-phosphate transferase